MLASFSFLRLGAFAFLILADLYCLPVFASHHHHSHHSEENSISNSSTTSNETLTLETHTTSETHAKSVIFYSFFVSMDKSAGYALPFANKLCYMAKYNYQWLLDVVPKNKVPVRNGHMTPTWYKPHGIAKWLHRVDYLIYLDMDLVVKRTDVDFVAKFTKEADLTVTDHNRALNNGAFVLKNSAWGRKFLSRWTTLSDSMFQFPFSDNGSFIEAILTFIPGYKKNCMKTGTKASEYLTCAEKFLKGVLGKFDGETDRVFKTEDGGMVRFVAPKFGFNSHEYNAKRPSMGWDKKACFNPDTGFILHTKEWTKEVPEGSDECPASQSGKLTTKGGEHLFGSWGVCAVPTAACQALLPPQVSSHFTGSIDFVDTQPLSKNHTKVKKSSTRSRHQPGLGKYLIEGKKVKKPSSEGNVSEPLPPPMIPYGITADGPENPDEPQSIIKNTTFVPCSLGPTSKVSKLSTSDRYGVLAIPKTATTSLTKLMQKGGLSASCGGVLWQISKPTSCPFKQQTSIVLRPSNWNPKEKNGRPKTLSHVLHPDFNEIHKAWDVHSDGRGRLKMVVVIREPVSRLFSAYTHGKQFKMQNQISPADKPADRRRQSLKERMNLWRSFYWSYKDYNDSTLLLTNAAKDFSEFAALPYLPTHNQQTRMLAGVRSSVIVDANILNIAKQNLCTIECVGVLENLDPLVACVSRQLGLSHQTLPEKNLHGATSHNEISPAARAAATSNGWADLTLHNFAADLVKNRPH